MNWSGLSPSITQIAIEDLLATRLSSSKSGKKIDMPAQQEIRLFKQRTKAKGKKQDDAKLF